MVAWTTCASRGGDRGSWIQVGPWGRDRFCLQVFPGCLPGIHSACNFCSSVMGAGRNLRAHSLSTYFFLPTRGCVYHFLLNPGGKMRKCISLGSTCKAKAKSLLNTALLPLIFVTDNSACSSMCVGEKDKRLCPGFPSLPQGASWVWVRHLCTCRGRRPSRLQQRRSSGSAPLTACVVV